MATGAPAPAPKPQSTADLMAGTSREFMLLAGKDGAGKTCFIVSVAAFVQQVLAPNATFHVIDTENKFPTALRSFGADAPTNIAYYKCDTMNDVTEAIDVIMKERKAGDWLAVESMARVWERAQDMGYQAVSGYGKVTYLDKRRAQARNAQAPVIPKPDEFWNVVKGAHDGAFIDLVSMASSLNVILSTTISRPPKDGGFIKENVDRKQARIEFGLDAGLDGAPRLPTYVETTILLDIQDKKIQFRVLRDNLSPLEDGRVTHTVEGKKMGAMTFWSNCRQF